MNYRDYEIKSKIKNVNKDIARDAAFVAGGALVVGAGIFGTIVFTKQLIDFYNSGEIITFKAKLAADWNESKIGFSLIPVSAGGIFLYNRIPKLKDNIQYRKRLKDNLKNKSNM